jgi:hypothetical protein
MHYRHHDPCASQNPAINESKESQDKSRTILAARLLQPVLCLPVGGSKTSAVAQSRVVHFKFPEQLFKRILQFSNFVIANVIKQLH